MRFSCLVLAVLFALSALVSRSAHADPPLAPYGKKWSYVWGDEFNGTTLDTSKWRLNREASRRGDRLHDGYLIRWRWEDDNVSVQDGNLVLTNTRQTPFEDADDLVMAAGINSAVAGVRLLHAHANRGAGHRRIVGSVSRSAPAIM